MVKNIINSASPSKIKRINNEIIDEIQVYNSFFENEKLDNNDFMSKIRQIPLEYPYLDEDADIFLANSLVLNDYLEMLRSSATEPIKILKGKGLDYKTIQTTIENLDNELLVLDENLRSYIGNLERVVDIKARILEVFRKYDNKMQDFENEVNEAVLSFLDNRTELFNKIFDGIEVEAKRYLDVDKFIESFTGLCYSGKFQNYENAITSINVNNYFESVNLNLMEKILQKKEDFKKDTGGYYSVLKFLFVDFINSYYEVKPKISLDEKEFGQMSGGQQATLMLKLKLATEGIRNDIILLDQPENHLDNKFIKEQLSKLFTVLKEEKQLILASHNANVIIGSDTEAIIVSNMDKENKNYHVGSVENFESKEEIIDILEGGKDAFRHRRNIYQI